MDERVRWVVIAVKHWAISLKLLSDDFSTYSLIWLVLYVMMHYKIVPPIVDLWKTHQKHEPNYTEGKRFFSIETYISIRFRYKLLRLVSNFVYTNHILKGLPVFCII